MNRVDNIATAHQPETLPKKTIRTVLLKSLLVWWTLWATTTSCAAASTTTAIGPAGTSLLVDTTTATQLPPPKISTIMELRLTLRLCVSALIGAAVGKERSQAGHHSAGIRTMSLVATGAAAFTICSMYGFGGMRYDPSRMASNVASGVGFIGAGVITTTSSSAARGKHHDSGNHNNNNKTVPYNSSVVHGLTTAAAIWLSAAVGVACGVGMYIVSAGCGALTIAILRFGNIKKKNKQRRDLWTPSSVESMFPVSSSGCTNSVSSTRSSKSNIQEHDEEDEEWWEPVVRKSSASDDTAAP